MWAKTMFVKSEFGPVVTPFSPKLLQQSGKYTRLQAGCNCANPSTNSFRKICSYTQPGAASDSILHVARFNSSRTQ